MTLITAKDCSASALSAAIPEASHCPMSDHPTGAAPVPNALRFNTTSNTVKVIKNGIAGIRPGIR
jgi:hypothetical protein